MSKANETQVGGNHYQTGGQQHWDLVIPFELDYFQAAITKYVFRHKKKDGLKDLRKAQHFIQKYIEILEAEELEVTEESARQHAASLGHGDPGDVFDSGDKNFLVAVRAATAKEVGLTPRTPNAVDATGAPAACLGCGAIYGHAATCPVIVGNGVGVGRFGV